MKPPVDIPATQARARVLKHKTEDTSALMIINEAGDVVVRIIGDASSLIHLGNDIAQQAGGTPLFIQEEKPE